MENEERERQRKSYVMMRMIYDVGMGGLILFIGVIMLFGERLKIPALTTIMTNIDVNLRYLFGGLCLLYGGFRLYRGLKHEY